MPVVEKTLLLQDIIAAVKAQAQAQGQVDTARALQELEKMRRQRVEVELMRERGMLNMRGAFEVAQQRRLQDAPEMKPKADGSKFTRKERWVHLLTHDEKLLGCLRTRRRGQPEDAEVESIEDVAERLAELYRHLSTDIPKNAQQSVTMVDIVGNFLNVEQRDMLECIIDDILPYRIGYQLRTRGSDSDDEDE